MKKTVVVKQLGPDLYEVKELVNRTYPEIGDRLNKTEVESLIRNINTTVRIVKA